MAARPQDSSDWSSLISEKDLNSIDPDTMTAIGELLRQARGLYAGRDTRSALWYLYALIIPTVRACCQSELVKRPTEANLDFKIRVADVAHSIFLARALGINFLDETRPLKSWSETWKPERGPFGPHYRYDVMQRAIEWNRHERTRAGPAPTPLDDVATFPDQGPLPDGHVYCQQICEAIDALPAKQRQVMLLRLEGFTNEDIAKKLKIAKGTVENHVSRARAQLRQYHASPVAEKDRRLPLEGIATRASDESYPSLSGGR